MRTFLKKSLKLLGGIGVSLLLISQGSLSLQAPPFRILLPLPVEQLFRNNLPSSALQDVFLMSVPVSEISLSNFASALQRPDAPDLVVMPRSFLLESGFAQLFLGFPGGSRLLRDLSTHRLELVDAGLVYIEFQSPYVEFQFQGFVVGAELPWDPNWMISISADTPQFDRALSFMRALGQNVLFFEVAGQRISVKAFLIENKTAEPAFDVHLQFDKPAEDADAAGRDGWECHEENNEVICQTKVDSLPPNGGRLAIGVAFLGDPGKTQECWLSGEDRARIGGC